MTEPPKHLPEAEAPVTCAELPAANAAIADATNDVRGKLLPLALEETKPLCLELPPGLKAKLAAIGANLTLQRQTEIRNELDTDKGLTPADREARDAFLRPEYPNTGVNEHLNAHHSLVDSLLQSGKIDGDTAKIMRVFIERHDNGYRQDCAALLEKKAARFQEIFAALGESLGLEKGLAQNRAAELHAFLLKHKSNYLVSKVLGHGVTSLALNVMWLEERGVEPAQAMALSQLIGAHHPGFPIGRLVADRYANWKGLLQDKTAADGSVAEKGVSPELRQLLLIDNDPSLLAKTDAEKEESADALRKNLILGAEKNGIPRGVGSIIAALGYALDRTVPSNELEIYKKKYPLIIGNIVADKTERSLACIYDTTIKVLRTEADAAVATAKNLGAPEQIVALIKKLTDEQIAQRVARQSVALAFGGDLEGFGGRFDTMDADLQTVEKVRDVLKIRKKTDTAELAACETLVKTLRSCQTAVTVEQGKQAEAANPGVKAIATLLRNPMDDAELKEVLSAILYHSIRNPQQNILQLKTVESSPAPTTLIEGGSGNDTVYIFLEGSTEFVNGKGPFPIKPPSIIGEISALYGQKASGTVRVPAGATAVLLQMPGEFFRSLQTTSSTFSNAIGAYTLKRVLGK